MKKKISLYIRSVSCAILRYYVTLTTTGSVVHFNNYESSKSEINFYVIKESDDYSQLTEFEAAGQVDLMAFMYLWQRATKLTTLRISGNIGELY